MGVGGDKACIQAKLGQFALPTVMPLTKRLPCVRGTKEAAQPVAAIAADESNEQGRAASELASAAARPLRIEDAVSEAD